MKIIVVATLTLLLIFLQGCAIGADDYSSIDESFPPALVEIDFESHGKRLNGLLYQANGPGPHPTVVLLHGYPGNEKNLDLAQDLRSAGFNALFFHYRGAWGSDGDYSLSNVIEDVASSTEFLRAEHAKLRVDAERLMLVGHSMGGFAALQGAASDDQIKCVAGIAPANTGLIAHAAAQDSELAAEIAAGADRLPMLNGWSGEKVLAELSTNADRFDITKLGPALSGKSVLLVAADRDKVLQPEYHHTPNVAAYLAQGDIDLTHVVLSGDHSFSWSRGELIDTVLGWLQDCNESNYGR